MVSSLILNDTEGMMFMHRSHDIIGLPVIELKTGKEVGRVRDLLFNERWQYFGLLLNYKGVFKQGRYLKAETISAIGNDCVLISNKRAISYYHSPDWIALFAGPEQLKGKPVVTTCGRHLGFIEDVYFQEKPAKIVAYELSDGILSDIMVGRKTLDHIHGAILGEEVLIVEEREPVL
ncbi:MAG TPA: photosystem reaction center subunit H [Paenibacillaceae bacterium]|nr:photosystem reaction center subunit H [Paenibacillaceae bacterium]